MDKLLCSTCGASEQDGNGPIGDLNGHATCELCRIGALELVASDPTNYGFGPDGRLTRLTVDPEATGRRAAVDQLRAALSHALAEVPGVTVAEGHPLSFVAVVLQNGFRWHVYLPGAGPYAGVYCHAALFNPHRTKVVGFPAPCFDDPATMRNVVAATDTRPDVFRRNAVAYRLNLLD